MNKYDFKEEARFLSSLDSTEYTITAVVIGLLISTNLSLNEKNSLGNFFFLIGQTMITLAAQENLTSNINHTYAHNEIEKELENLRKEINDLKKTNFKRD